MVWRAICATSHFVDSTGATVKGSQVIYGGQPAGYTATSLEAINYCSVHDDQTLFDAIQLKSAIPGTTATGGDSIAQRTRRQVLAMSLIALGQGIPFFFGGDDLLASKDMDDNRLTKAVVFRSQPPPYHRHHAQM